MIQVQSKLKTMDNSGADNVMCIRALGGSNRTYAYPGDYIIVSIKKLRLIRKVKKGEVFLGVVTRTKKETVFKDGTSSKFGENAVVLLNKRKRILGTRLFG